MQVYGEKDGLSNMPDGEFEKPVALRCGEQMLKRGVYALKGEGPRDGLRRNPQGDSDREG